MSNRAIIIGSKKCGEKQCIVTYNDKGDEGGRTELEQGESIIFVNALGTRTEAKVYFYESVEGKVDTTPIDDFCVGKGTDPFAVRLLNVCQTEKPPGTFKYKVEASNYEPEDPVIIIETATFNFLPVLIGVIVLLTGLTAYFAKMYWSNKD